MATTLSDTTPHITSWAEAVEQDTARALQKTEEIVKVSTVEEEGRFYKVTTTYQQITKRVPREVALRKQWKKFGQCRDEESGPQASTTMVAEEVPLQFVRNRAGEQILDVQEDKKEKTSSREHCRHCKADDHWSANCPYKEMYMQDDDPIQSILNATEQKEAGLNGGAGAGPGGARDKYVPPGTRGGAGLGGPGAVDPRRSDENTCRVTNLPVECDEQELREIFAKCGRVQRVYIARDKYSNQPKGFAFVSYDMRMDAERAIEQLNGYKLHHMVLKVEWTRPSGDR